MTDNLTTIQVDKETSAKLGAIAKRQRRSKAAQVAVLVENAYRQEFDVVQEDYLPRPVGGEKIKDFYVQKRDPA